MVEVHVILTGIVSLIPRTPAAGFLVRLQDGRAWHEPHFPNLTAQIDRVTGAAPNAFQPLTDGRVLGSWLIPNGAITVNSTIQDAGLTDELRQPLDIVAGAPGCGEAKKSPIGVELVVEKGSLATISVTPQAWFYDHETSAQARVLSHEVCWSFTIAAAPLLVTFPGFGQLAVAAQPNGHIELRLQNTPPSEFFPQLPEAQSSDNHIGHYFEQCTCPNPPPPPPNGRFLIAYEGAVMIPSLQAHSTHELSGIVLAVLHPPDPPLASDASEAISDAPAPLRAPRINCPPALWESLQP